VLHSGAVVSGFHAFGTAASMHINKPPPTYSLLVKVWTTPLTPFSEQPLILDILAAHISGHAIYFDQLMIGEKLVIYKSLTSDSRQYADQLL
jgi:hypothetical protein